ncbi:MAG TPA: PEP-CTERM sorting domain-containing protein [Chthoniobacteraceae bacterium]|nr:PEP-CTERM sorting domain-containing protein [Chthoniobacteraceae bacterium]
MSIHLIVCAFFALLFSAHSPAAYVTGFESPPFNSGTINGQDSWTMTGSLFDTSRIRTASEIAADLANGGFTVGDAVHSGSQALMVSGVGANNSTVRVVAGFEGVNKVTLDVWARPLPLVNSTSASGNIFLTMEDASGVRAAAFRFGTQFGMTIDYGSALSNPWVPSNVTWDSDTWYHLTMALDYNAKTYDFTINDAIVNVDPIPFYNVLSTNFTQIRLFRGQNPAGMLVDDLTVIPEPTTLGCLLAGAGACAISLRRRHKVA